MVSYATRYSHLALCAVSSPAVASFWPCAVDANVIEHFRYSYSWLAQVLLVYCTSQPIF
jgi:hypothetical protein